MTDDVLDRVDRILSGITEEPWVVQECRDPFGPTTYSLPDIEQYRGYRNTVNCGTDRALAEFIAASRTLMPELADALRAARTENEQLREEADRWQSMWRQDLENADTAMRERDEANAENERLQEGLGAMRSSLTAMRHSTMCATFIDGAPEPDCTCDRGAVLAWIDNLRKGPQR